MFVSIPSLMTARKGIPSSASTLLNGLQVYYKLEDTSDSSGAGMTLTNNNTVTFVAGKVNNCANFVAASSQSLSHADATAYQVGTSDFTFAFWFNTSSTSAQDAAVSYGNTGANGWAARLIGGGSNGLQIQVADGPHLDLSDSNLTINDSNWHLAVATASRSGNLTLYIDNSVVGTPHAMTATGSVNSVNGDGFCIGCFGTNSPANFWNGKVDEAGLWNRVLTSTERGNLYNSGTGITYPFTGF